MNRGRRRDPSYQDSDYEADMDHERRRAQTVSPCSDGRARVAKKPRAGRSSADGTSEEEGRRRRRLLANRRSAQRSRVKRLEEVGVLEGLVDELMKEVDELRSEVSVWTTRHQELLAEEQMLSAQVQGAALSPTDAADSAALRPSPTALAAAAALSMDAAGGPWEVSSPTHTAGGFPVASGPLSCQLPAAAPPLLPQNQSQRCEPMVCERPEDAEQSAATCTGHDNSQTMQQQQEHHEEQEHEQQLQHSSPRRGTVPSAPTDGDAMVCDADTETGPGTGTDDFRPVETDTHRPSAGDSAPVPATPNTDLTSDGAQGYSGAVEPSPSRPGCTQSHGTGRTRGHKVRRGGDIALSGQLPSREPTTPNAMVVHQPQPLPYTVASRPTSSLSSSVIALGCDGVVAIGSAATAAAGAVPAQGATGALRTEPGLCRRKSDFLPRLSDPTAASLMAAAAPGGMSPSRQPTHPTLNSNLNVPMCRTATTRLAGTVSGGGGGGGDGRPPYAVTACGLLEDTGMCMSHLDGALSGAVGMSAGATFVTDPCYTHLAASPLGDGACLVAATLNGRGGWEDALMVSQPSAMGLLPPALFSKLSRPVTADSGGNDMAEGGNGHQSFVLAPHEVAAVGIPLGAVRMFTSMSPSLTACAASPQEGPLPIAAATAAGISSLYHPPTHTLHNATAQEVPGPRSPQLSSAASFGAAFSHTATEGAGSGNAVNVLRDDVTGLGNLTPPQAPAEAGNYMSVYLCMAAQHVHGMKSEPLTL